MKAETDIWFVIFSRLDDYRDLYRLQQALFRYFPGQMIEIIYLKELTGEEQKMISFPHTPSILLTPELSAAGLETRLVEIFGAPRVYGVSDKDFKTQRALGLAKALAQTALQKSIFQAECQEKIGAAFILSQAPNPQYLITQITIQHMFFNKQNILQLCELLQTSTSLTYLCFTDNEMPYEEVDFFCTIFRHNNWLIYLDVSHNLLENAIAAFGDMLSTNQTLEYLDVSSNHSDSTVATAFCAGLTHNSHLRHLSLEYCALDDKALDYITTGLLSNRTLTSLNIASNNFSSSSLNRLLDHMLGSAIILNALDMSETTRMDPTTYRKLSEILRRNLRLTTLKLNYSFLTKEHFEMLVLGLTENHTLLNLELKNTPFSGRELNMLASALQLNKTLEFLGISIRFQNLHEYDPDHDLDWPKEKNLLSLAGITHSEDEYDDTDELNSFSRSLLYLIEINLKAYSTRPLKETDLYGFFQLLESNYSLRQLSLHIESPWDKLPALFKLALKKTSILINIETSRGSPSKSLLHSIKKIAHKTRKQLTHRRSEFINLLLLLELCVPWKQLPLDIKLIILNILEPEKTYRLAKSREQTLACARFIFSHILECQNHIKTNQKITIVERLITPQKHSFNFFKPDSQKKPASLIVQKNNPLTFYKPIIHHYNAGI